MPTGPCTCSPRASGATRPWSQHGREGPGRRGSGLLIAPPGSTTRRARGERTFAPAESARQSEANRRFTCGTVLRGDVGARHKASQVAARADSELGEDLSQVPLDGAVAEVQPLTDLLVPEPFGGQRCDLLLLGREVGPGLCRATAHLLPCGQQL